MRVPLRRLAVTLAVLGGLIPLSLSPAGASAAQPGYQPLPNLPVNSCNDTTLPISHGTNFPAPSDPHGFGYANQSVIGWEGNWFAPFAYLSGSYFARGVPVTHTRRGQNYCGAMYSFGVYTYGLAAGRAPAPGSVQWTMADGYLPAMTTSFTRDDVSVSIKGLRRPADDRGQPRADVTNASSYTTNLNAFNTVTFDPVTTTQLRAVFDTGFTPVCTGACHAVGVLQWVAAGN